MYKKKIAHFPLSCLCQDVSFFLFILVTRAKFSGIISPLRKDATQLTLGQGSLGHVYTPPKFLSLSIISILLHTCVYYKTYKVQNIQMWSAKSAFNIIYILAKQRSKPNFLRSKVNEVCLLGWAPDVELLITSYATSSYQFYYRDHHNWSTQSSTMLKPTRKLYLCFNLRAQRWRFTGPNKKYHLRLVSVSNEQLHLFTCSS